MPNLNRIKNKIKEYNFKDLFLDELGWDDYDHDLQIVLGETTFSLEAIAHKRGMISYKCIIPGDQDFPDYQTRRKLENKVLKSIREHIIIFIAPKETFQIWQWVRREVGKPTACREHKYYSNQTGESLAQKLSTIAFSLEEEEDLTSADVSLRVQTGLDVEKITKRFYDRFKKEHDAFFKFLNGIPDKDLKTWYASVMLNRLMFIYFIQKKGFLDKDENYLLNKLALLKDKGKDQYYKEFLCPLFFEGFAKPSDQRSQSMNNLLGEVPYLNGGIFQKHQIEQLHGKDIEIPDKAFDQLFSFFDAYHWHLDERPMRSDNEINPDVLGYIFEKYINQKQMGAYYTKEDITEYISRNTVIPHIFDMAKEKCKVAFEGDQSIWNLLKANPDRYIFDAVKKGVDKDLPKYIADGIDNVAKRTRWNEPAQEDLALPTEIWRETVARRQRYDEVKVKLQNGELHSINDLITYNLDIRQFAQDTIENCEGPELLRAIWRAIVGRIPEKSNEKFQQGISILDPTCGSGAFLFAALNILEPLYEACLDRMQAFVDELSDDNQQTPKDKYKDFKTVLKEVRDHHNEKYFIYKTIIINNLFGVDIMAEAVEICKLRLFLKMVAQIEKAENLEPLPDIDFNVRAGNTLVGFASLDEVKKSMEGDWIKQQVLPEIEEKAEDVDRQYNLFRQMQVKQDMKPELFSDTKKQLESKLKILESQLNEYLAEVYAIDPQKKTKYDSWLKSHQPFHWYVDFYGIINSGGFDVIIGNPPYVEYGKKIKQEYTVQNYATEDCSNLYAFVVERSINLLSNNGRTSLIIPLPAINTNRMKKLQSILKPSPEETSRSLWVSAFDERPGKLFTGVDQRLIIIILGNLQTGPCLFTTGINRWHSAAREVLFSTLIYTSQSEKEIELVESILKFKDNPIEANLIRKFYSNAPLFDYLSSNITKEFVSYRTAGGRYWKIVLDEPFESESLSNKITYLRSIKGQQAASVIMSSTFWWYYSTHFDMYNLKDYMIFGFRFSSPKDEILNELGTLGHKLKQSLLDNSTLSTIESRTRGVVESRLYVVNKSKEVLDEIDKVLAKHYGFTDEELDFIINYDIKYRMGKELNSEGGDE